jgi:(p)ppGpp synthase/HD superfamily hydrolase
MDKAEAFARHAHAGQTDKSGAPYAGHLARVSRILVERFPDALPFEIEAAWLHDVLEDTPTTAEDLVAAGISPAAIAIVRELTRPPGPTYLEWIGTLAAVGSLSAIRIKLADNQDNQDPARVAALPNGARMVAKRYAPAKAILERALTERFG